MARSKSPCCTFYRVEIPQVTAAGWNCCSIIVWQAIR